MKYLLNIFFISFITLTVISCGSNDEAEEKTEIIKATVSEEDTIPTNVVAFFIPGMDQELMSLLLRDPNANLIKSFNRIGYYAPRSYFEPYADMGANVTALMTGITTVPGLVGLDKDSSLKATWIDAFKKEGYQIGLITDGLLGKKPIDALFSGNYSEASIMENTVQNLVKKKPDFIWGMGRQLFDRRSDRKLLFDEMSVSDYHLNFNISDRQIGTRSKYAGIYYYYSAPDTIDLLQDGMNTWNRFTSRKKSPFLSVFMISSLGERLEKNSLSEVWKLNQYLDELERLLDNKMDNTLVLIINPFQDQNRDFNLVQNDSLSYSATNATMNQTYLPIWAYGKGSEAFSGYYDNVDLYKKMTGILKRD